MAKSFGLGHGLSLGLTLSGLGLDLGLMASSLGLIEISLVASNIYSAHDVNYYSQYSHRQSFLSCIGRLLKTMTYELVFLKCNDC